MTQWEGNAVNDCEVTSGAAASPSPANLGTQGVDPGEGTIERGVGFAGDCATPGFRIFDAGAAVKLLFA